MPTPTTTFAFHEGERAVQRRAGQADVAQRVGRGIRPEIPDAAAAFLLEQPLLVVASRDTGGRMWSSLLTGPPGFATARDDRTIVADARPHPGDPLAGALTDGAEAPVGLLAIEPATRRRMRVNGRAHVDGDGRVVVHTDEVYANCPKYIARREIADAEPPAPPVPARTGDALDARRRAVVAAADTFFIATAHPQRGGDASHRGGEPGFVAVRDERHLTFPDYQGNGMYMTLGNLEVDPHVGLLFVDWEGGDVLMLSGTAHVDWSPERAATVPGALRLVDVAIERVVELPGASPLRWRLQERSRFNPPVAV